MDDTYLTTKEAARLLGIQVATLYDWLGQSDHGLLMIRGETFTIDYFQAGRRGQGRIQIARAEVERIRDAMRVRPNTTYQRRTPVKAHAFPGITVALGRPDN